MRRNEQNTVLRSNSFGDYITTESLIYQPKRFLYSFKIIQIAMWYMPLRFELPVRLDLS